MKRNLYVLSRKFLQQPQNSNSLHGKRFISTNQDIDRRNHLFTLEKKRQIDDVGRIEKIEVQYKGLPNDCSLVMNKNISTPFDCARHLSEWHMNSSGLAVIDGEVYWDMHRPITDSCTLEFQNYQSPDPTQVNKAFWRTCSLVLGASVTAAFKDDVTVRLHSFPGPDIRSGSFTYDIELSLPNWSPTDHELRALSAEYVKLVRSNWPVERLEVTEQLALEMFKDNEHKSEQIPSIAKNQGKVTLYRVDKHVDISKGPMIGNTSQIGRVTVASVHKITESQNKHLYRFQGVALPNGVRLDHFAYGILEKRAKKLNPVKSPLNPSDMLENTRQSVAATV